MHRRACRGHTANHVHGLVCGNVLASAVNYQAKFDLVVQFGDFRWDLRSRNLDKAMEAMKKGDSKTLFRPSAELICK